MKRNKNNKTENPAEELENLSSETEETHSAAADKTRFKKTKRKPAGEAAVGNRKKLVLDNLKKYAVITLGCIIYSLGISLFIKPVDLSSGGMTGISIILGTFIPIDNGILLVILNIPMLILGLIYFGWQFLISTGYATVTSSLLMTLWTEVFGEGGLDVLPFTGKPVDASALLINAVVGGVLFGIGMGLIFRMGASTAGTDVIVKLLRKKFRYLKTGSISLITDLLIVVSSLFVNGYNVEKLFYTALSTVVFTLVFDWVLYGGNSAKTVFIITAKENCDRMVNRILKEIDTGATVVDAKGAYSNEGKAMIICVVKPFLYPRLRDVVHEEDKHAFMIISSAKEIYGEGYQSPDDAEL